MTRPIDCTTCRQGPEVCRSPRRESGLWLSERTAGELDAGKVAKKAPPCPVRETR